MTEPKPRDYQVERLIAVGLRQDRARDDRPQRARSPRALLPEATRNLVLLNAYYDRLNEDPQLAPDLLTVAKTFPKKFEPGQSLLSTSH